MSQKNAYAPLSALSRAGMDDLFLRMNQKEIRIVAKVVQLSKPKPLQLLVDGMNRLCNGWIYLPVAIYVISVREWKLLIALSIGVSVAHLFYGTTKPRFARVRPCNFAGSIPSRSRCLDEYSFPSGHCMTLSVVGLLLSWQHHAALSVLAIALLILCWARMASGHHYPSDLVAGVGVGYAVGAFVALCIF